MAEAQVAESAESKGASPETSNSPSLSPDEKRKILAAEQAHKARRRQELELQREHILSQRTSNAHRRTALEMALAEIEAQLVAL